MLVCAKYSLFVQKVTCFLPSLKSPWVSSKSAQDRPVLSTLSSEMLIGWSSGELWSSTYLVRNWILRWERCRGFCTSLCLTLTEVLKCMSAFCQCNILPVEGAGHRLRAIRMLTKVLISMRQSSLGGVMASTSQSHIWFVCSSLFLHMLFLLHVGPWHVCRKSLNFLLMLLNWTEIVWGLLFDQMVPSPSLHVPQSNLEQEQHVWEQGGTHK